MTQVSLSLTDMMARWKELRIEADALEVLIEQEVLRLGKTQKYNGVVASYTAGRGRYDYEAAAKAANAPGFVIEQFTTPVVDWRKVCEAVLACVDTFYTPGTPGVTVKLEKA